MQSRAEMLRNPLLNGLGRASGNGEANGKEKTGGTSEDATAGKFIALRNAGKTAEPPGGDARKRDAARSEMERPEFSVSTLGTIRGQRAGERTDAELADVLEKECGWVILTTQ